MTIEEAEVLYKQYGGQAFHMGREEPGEKYDAFTALNIPTETLCNWKKEMIEDTFAHLWDKEADVWWKYHSIIKMMNNTDWDARLSDDEILFYSKRLVDEMSGMEYLDKDDRYLILKDMIESGIYTRLIRSDYADRTRRAVAKVAAPPGGTYDDTVDIKAIIGEVRYEADRIKGLLDELLRRLRK